MCFDVIYFKFLFIVLYYKKAMVVIYALLFYKDQFIIFVGFNTSFYEFNCSLLEYFIHTCLGKSLNLHASIVLT